MIRPKKNKNLADRNSDRYTSLATTILETKNSAKYYEISGSICQGLGDDLEWTDLTIQVHLSNEEISFLTRLLADSDEGTTLSELHDKIPFYDKLSPNLWWPFVPEKIDLIHQPIKCYEFSVLKTNYDGGNIDKANVMVPLDDEEYKRLLIWKLRNRTASFNSLAQYDPRLYCMITQRIIESDYWFECAFMIFPYEVEKDVFKAVGEPDFNFEISSWRDGKYLGLSHLYISEKKLYIHGEHVTEPNLSGKRVSLNGIDAIAIENSFHVSTYKELGDIIKNQYGDRMDGIYRFKEFLDSNRIDYSLEDTDDTPNL